MCHLDIDELFEPQTETIDLINAIDFYTFGSSRGIYLLICFYIFFKRRTPVLNRQLLWEAVQFSHTAHDFTCSDYTTLHHVHYEVLDLWPCRTATVSLMFRGWRSCWHWISFRSIFLYHSPAHCEGNDLIWLNHGHILFNRSLWIPSRDLTLKSWNKGMQLKYSCELDNPLFKGNY